MILRVAADPAALAREVALAMADLIRRAAATYGSSRVVLAGGSTPAGAYRRLAALDLPWERSTWFFGDERAVPPDDPDSNARMARESLFNRVPVPAGAIHMIDGAAGSRVAAERYESLLRNLPPRPGGFLFDLALLGLGEDGHTASLFPDDPVLAETSRRACAVLGPAGRPPRERITLTPACLALAAERWFLVSGEAKREILARMRDSGPTPSLPATLLAAGATWFVDAAAAGP